MDSGFRALGSYQHVVEAVNRYVESAELDPEGKWFLEALEVGGRELRRLSQKVVSENREYVRAAFNSVRAKELLAERGFDQNLGARPLKRVIQKTLLDPLALKIVSGEVGGESKVIVGVVKGEIDIQTAYAMPRLKKDRAVKTESR